MRELMELQSLWTKLLGELPSTAQFEFWLETHQVDVVRRGILKTAEKNLNLGNTMSQDHKIRFASKVMLTASAQREENATNRERLNAEMEGRAL